MSDNLLIELIAQHNRIFEVLRQAALMWIAVIPHLRLTHEVEAPALNHSTCSGQSVCAEEDCRTKYPLESRYEPAVLLTTLMHAKSLQHFRSSAETNCLTVLTNSQSSQKNWHDTILSERQSELRVTSYLKGKLTISSFIHELAGGWRPERQSTQHEWSGAKRESLLSFFSLQTDQSGSLDLSRFLSGDLKFTMSSFQDVAHGFQTVGTRLRI